jgi:hypothetical protein
MLDRLGSMKAGERIGSHASPRLISAIRDFVWNGVPPIQSKS